MKGLNKRRILSIVLAFALIVSGFTSVNVYAAKKATLKFIKTSLSLKQGKKATLRITKKYVKKIKSTKWSTSNKKIATVSQKGKVTAVKAGKATISAKVTYVAKGSTKAKKITLKCKVTVKGTNTSTSSEPAVSATTGGVTAETAAPSVNPTASAITPTEVPTETPTEIPTEIPTETPLAHIVVTPFPLSLPSIGVLKSNIVDNGAIEDSNLTEEHQSQNDITTQDNGLMRTNLTAQDITKVMSLGWNVGNSLEQTGAGSIETKTDEEKAALTDAEWVTGYETNAGNPVSSQTLMSGLKAYGINTIRIPIAWSNMMTVEEQEDGSKYYKISDAYFDRVEEVINYCLNEEMYVVINIHWDGQWWGMFGDQDTAVQEQAWKKYTDMWTQIAVRYAEYSDRLIFEGANEELGERLNDNWQGDGGSRGVLTEEETFALTNEINQRFVDIVRGLGVNSDGTKNNNYYRFLLIPGYDTNLHQTCGDQYSDKAKQNNEALTYTMPTDVADNGISKLFVSIHYYDPLGWGIAKTAASYETPKGISNFMDSWGTPEDYAAMQEDFDAVKEAYIDKGYGVIFGEFGVVSMNKDGIPAYFKQFFESCKEIGCVPIMWDEGGIVDRKGTGNRKKLAYFIYEDIGNVFLEITGSEVKLGSEASKATTITGKPENLIAENQNPLVVATWEGNFMRNTSGSASVNYDKIKEVFGEDFVGDMSGNTSAMHFDTKEITINPDYEGLELTATSDTANWHSHFLISDWSKFKEPGVRITMHDDMISRSAQLQLVFSDGLWDDEKTYSWKYESDYEQVESVKGDTYTAEQIAALPETVNYYTIKDGEKEPFSDALPKLDENMQPVLAETAWQEKALKLNTKYLENNPVVLLTTNTYLGVDFVKVEFVDLAYTADGEEFIGESVE